MRKRVQQGWADQPHEASEADERHLLEAQSFGHRCVVRIARRIPAMVHDAGFDTGRTRALETGDAGRFEITTAIRAARRCSSTASISA